LDLSLSRPASVLYVGDLEAATTSVARAEALESLGLPLLRFGTDSICRHSKRWLNILGHHFYCTPGVLHGNHALLSLAAEKRPEVVWIDKGRWLFPSTLRKLRLLGARLCHYNTDDIYGGERVLWLHRLGLRQYDCALTTNRFNVTEISQQFKVRTYRAGMGYDSRIHVPEATINPSADVPDVLFIGHRESHTEEYVTALMNAGVKVAIYGYHWNNARNPALRKVMPLPQSEYARQICSAKFSLCVLSRKNRNESTGRSFEIPAIGGCLLAEDTDEHRFFYRDEQEAVFFEGTEQLLVRCREWLKRESARLAVREAGHRRCISLGLSWKEHMKREWGIAVQMFDASGDILDENDEPFWKGFRKGESYCA
jgi:hypothetical protein